MASSSKTRPDGMILLPPPRTSSRFALERAIAVRRSIRNYTRESVTLEELAQLLWSCQGITSSDGLRTSPSAGAVYPLEIYALAERVAGLPAGIYHYRPGLKEHYLELIQRGKFGAQLFELSTKQDFIKRVAVNLVLATVTARMEKEYGAMAARFVHMEMGHAAQNVHLQAEALGLGSVAVGYLRENDVQRLLGIEAEPQYMISIGRRKP